MKREEIFITKIRKEYDGSVTVEMSLLFPIVVFVIVIVMLMAFYVSDIVSIRAKVYEYCIMVQTEAGQTEEELKNELQKELKGYTIIAKIKSVNTKRKNEKIEMSVDIEYDFGYFDMHKKDTINAVSYNENTRDYIIRQKVIIDTVKDIK